MLSIKYQVLDVNGVTIMAISNLSISFIKCFFIATANT